jgi:ABC-type branched-subunit amino acid transport system ATPase component/branched-subunit amino acid ABC-type transport system permease component
MSSFLPFILLGITTGSVYALAGVGLVLTYKISGVFNFAYGAVGSVAAYLFYWLNVDLHVAWPIAGLVAFALLGIVVGFGFETLGRGLSRVPVAFRIAATVGILTSVEAALTIIFGPDDLTFPQFLPMSGFTLLGVNVTYEQVIVTCISIVAMASLYALFRLTRLGMAMRAIVESPTLLALTGTGSRRVGRWAWVIGCAFATLSGLLLAPDVPLNPTTLTLLVVEAFGAAAIGGFSNLPLTWVGGILIGIVESILTKYGSTNAVLAGASPSVPFIVLFVVLVFSRRTSFGVRQLVTPPRPAAWRMPPRAQCVVAIIALLFFLLVPTFAGYQLAQWTILLSDALLFLSLGLLVRTAGEVSLCQVSFAAIGVVAFSKLLSAGVPWIPALLIGGLCVVPVGAVLAIPAIRFSGLYLALATFGFALLLEDMFYSSSFMFGTTGISVPVPHLSWLNVGSTTGYYYVVLAITVIGALVVLAITQSRLGRLLRGISNSPTAMSASGSSVKVALALVFCLSAFIAGVAGVLNGGALNVATGDNYDPFISLEFVVIVLIAAGGVPWYAITSALAFVIIPLYFHNPNAADYLQVLFGVSAVAIAVTGQPQFALFDRMRNWIATADSSVGRALQRGRQRKGLGTASPAGRMPSDRPGVDAMNGGVAGQKTLEVTGLSVQYGGLRAVNCLSLYAETGAITGLIGPNGAGKSSALAACSGLVRSREGHVVLGGQDITDMSPAARARFGLGRTFQRSELFDSLTVRENISLGFEACAAGSSVLRQLVGKRSDRRIQEQRVDRAFELCHLEDVSQQLAGSLPAGQRRVVEIARCLAGPFQILLLDEPCSGLDRIETEELGRLLTRLVQVEGLGILLVEHDMSLVMSVCHRIYVLDGGELIFTGTPDTVQQSDAVRAAYLGGEAVGTTV